MNITGLRYFIAVAQHAGFTEAAERVFVSRSALSQQVDDLETELGVQLFVRDEDSLSLTEPGRRLLDEAREIVRRFDNLPKTVVRDDDDVRGLLRIGYQGFLDTAAMYRTMKELARQHPHIDFTLSRGTPPELRHHLLSGECDLVFTLYTCVKSMDRVEFLRVHENRLQVAVPAGHPLASRDVITMGQLEHENLVMLEHRVSPLTVDHVTDLCMRSGFSPRVTHYVDNVETALFHVGAGRGITFLHSRMSAAVASEDIKVLDLDGMDHELDYVMACRSDNRNPLVPIFEAELRRTAN